MSDEFWMMVVAGCVLFVIVMLIFAFRWDKKHPPEERRAKYEAERDARRTERNERLEVERRKQEVIRTKLIDSSHTATSHAKVGSAVGRAVIGGALLGVEGAIGGALTAKQKVQEHHEYTFKVWYADGHDEIKTVSRGSHEYNVFMSKLDLD